MTFPFIFCPPLLKGTTVTLQQSCICTKACRYTHAITHNGDPVIALVMAESFTVALITQRSILQPPLGFLLLFLIRQLSIYQRVSSLHPSMHSSLCLFQSDALFCLYIHFFLSALLCLFFYSVTMK